MTSAQAVIVGAGHAGAMAAMELRGAGYDGRIVLVGEEPHLPYERPPLSKAQLLNPGADPVWLHERAALEDAAVDLALGRRVTAIDRAAARVEVDGGAPIAFDSLLLAPGGVARPLPVPGGEHALTLRKLDDARDLQARLRRGMRLVVVGAGVIGLEVASSAASLGCDVMVLESQPGPMSRSIESVMQKYLVDLHAARGVRFAFGANVTAIEAFANGGFALSLEDGRMLEANLIVAGIGLKPNLDLASQAGLATAEGILVDAYGATSDPAIRAAGDATSFFHPDLGRHVHWQTWQHAQNHGKAVARNIAGQATAYAPAFWFWSDQHGVNIQVAGSPTEAERTILRGDITDTRFAAFHLRNGALVGATLVNNGGMVRPVLALIRSAAVLDAAQLADPAIPLRNLVAR